LADAALWLVVVAFWGLGDTATTVVAVQRYGIEERNTIMRRVFERYGVWSAVPAKVVGLSVMYMGWWFLESPFSTYVLVPIAALGVVVTAWNARQVWRVADHQRGRG